MTLPTEEIIVTRDVVGLTVDFDGKPTRRYGLIWNEIPTTLAYLKPYVIAPLKDVIEIRMLRSSKSGTLVQAIPIPGIIATSQENFIDLETHQLNGLREMLKTIESDDDFDYKQRVFLASKNKIYVMCMKNFISQVKQYVRLAHYEDALILCDELKNTEHIIDDYVVENAHVEYAYSLMKNGDFRNAVTQFIETKIDPRMVISLIPGLLHGKFVFDHQDKADLAKMFEDETTKNRAITAMIPYLTVSRIPMNKVDLDQREIEIGEAVDTALLKAYLVSSQTLLAAFLKMPNRSNIEASENLLKSAKKWVELVIFYKSKGMHQTALEMLKNQSLEDGPLRGIRPTIEYLQTIDDKSLILEYAKWVMLKDSQEGLEVFIRENLPLSAEEVLDFLEKRLSLTPLDLMKLKMTFMEKIVKKSTDPNFHNQMILFYLQILGFEEYKDKEQVRSRLKQFLNESKHYKADKVLGKFTSDEFSEEKAILLSRVNEHSQALRIYLRLKRPNDAEKYCEEHYANKEGAKDVFFILVQSHLSMQPPNIGEAVRILEKHADKIDFTLVLKELPSDILMSDLKGYFEKSLRFLNDKRREVMVMQNLTKAEEMQIQDQLIREKQKYLVVKQSTLCPVCDKMIGTRVFYWYPNGKVCHVMCAKDLNVCPVTGVNFAKEYGMKQGKYVSPKEE